MSKPKLSRQDANAKLRELDAEIQELQYARAIMKKHSLQLKYAQCNSFSYKITGLMMRRSYYRKLVRR